MAFIDGITRAVPRTGFAFDSRKGEIQMRRIPVVGLVILMILGSVSHGRAQEEGKINPDLPAEAAIDSLFSMAIGLTIFAAWEPDKDMGPALQVAEALATGTFLTKPHSPISGS